ncbi:hypothetical protein HGO37_19660 [Rhizobium sp. CG4]|jgi:hypothetical protein|uniref:hypothetical protein n=1 Tax=Rhizobium sp. CG4 TaxID=2726075 RepID=UPI0020337B52|nr:hypothetical protein [Rhizobium sp. CG4]MCM2457615.1 hypothetical protein [Rhizobium sp. CG4]
MTPVDLARLRMSCDGIREVRFMSAQLQCGDWINLPRIGISGLTDIETEVRVTRAVARLFLQRSPTHVNDFAGFATIT